MKKKMKVAVMNGRQEVAIEHREIPLVQPGQVLIRIKHVGVCGSDLHYYAEGKIGEVAVETPFVLGHEAAGEVVEVGADVQGLAVGDLVALEAGVPCGSCEFCRLGRYNICEEMRFLATPPIDGVFSEYVAYPAKWVYPLPDTMTTAQGALIEPLAVGMHAAEIGAAGLGDTAFIFGCGCIGLLTLLVLKSRGVAQVYMSDVIPARMEKASQLGATKVFDAGKEDVIKAFMEATGGRGADSVYEMTGTSNALAQSVEAVRKGGVIVLVGLGAETTMEFDFGALIWKEVQIRTCFRYQNIYPKAIRAISSGMIEVKDVISDTVKLDDVPQALQDHLKYKSEMIKMIVEMG